jgi:hypothetical protein
MHAWLTLLAWAQAIYYVVTGVWPLVHMPSFLAVTGPKNDLWLVKTVGVLIVCIGLSLGAAARRDAISLETMILAVSSAIALAGVDINYVARKVIPPIYLLDAVPEILIAAAWLLLWRR